MTTGLRRLLRAKSSGLAALEFALLFPVLVAMLGGVTDFGLSLWSRGRLANAVSVGAQYAFLAGTNVTSTAIASAVTQAAALTLGSTDVTVPAAVYYCVNGTPATATAATSTTICLNGFTAGQYVQITATYKYPSVFPFFSRYVGTTTLTETATVRLQ